MIIIKFIKLFACILLFLLVSTAVFYYYPYDPTPPVPALKVNGDEVPWVTGSYTWRTTWLVFSRGICVTSGIGPMLVKLEDLSLVPVQPLSPLEIDFKRKPLELSYFKLEDPEAFNWDVEIVYTEVNENSKIILPEKPGVYMYVLKANWKQGVADYGFLVEVMSSN